MNMIQDYVSRIEEANIKLLAPIKETHVIGKTHFHLTSLKLWSINFLFQFHKTTVKPKSFKERKFVCK